MKKKHRYGYIAIFNKHLRRFWKPMVSRWLYELECIDALPTNTIRYGKATDHAKLLVRKAFLERKVDGPYGKDFRSWACKKLRDRYEFNPEDMMYLVPGAVLRRSSL